MRHPKRTDVIITNPTVPSGPGTWTNPKAIAVFVPSGGHPAEICDIALAPADLPKCDKKLRELAGSSDSDPPLCELRSTKTIKAGAIVRESDGRVWLVEPTNHFAGTVATVPKGTLDAGACPRLTALHEIYEETGLVVRLGRVLGDVERGSDAIVRLYDAVRLAGSPTDMGWESQAVMLVPMNELQTVMAAEKEASFRALVVASYH